MHRSIMNGATRTAFTFRPLLFRLALAVGIILFFALLSRAGGPKYVAGTSYFDSSVSGQPLVWPGGIITYYTDQGDLSPILPNASANTFVASAFSLWTLVPTAGIAASSGGQLAENVDGSNVYVNSNGTITMPADIQPSAIGTPVGVVYDYDGSVTDALIGAGAGDPSQCFFNAVYGGDDNFGALATYQHALIVINGQCALASSQLVDVQYRLVRVIGEVLGVGWSQVNPNVQTGNPPPTADDYAGFPVMHYTDDVRCVPITNCYSNPDQFAVDDVASLSRLYPITAQNQSSVPGSQIFSAVTARIYGSVWFTNASGSATQAMQGVNVVARWVDPTTGQPSRQYAASAVSGFLFTGDAGNPITGFSDALGNPLSQWGSSSTTLEGFFDLAGLPLPDGGSAQYQLTVEPLDLTWSVGVGPYEPMQVNPSGLTQPIVVTVAAGDDVEQDIHMSGSAQPVPQWSSSETWATPASVPQAGDWMGSLNSYGDVAYFLLPAQANRTLSVTVTALDESGIPSESKVQPVIGMWNASDPQGTAPPAFTPSPFNSATFGASQLDAQILTSASFLIGIGDVRGDGRPDYRYHASVLYADSVSPQRLGVGGGAITILGTGFAPGLTTTVGSASATPLAIDAGQMILVAPPLSDGPESITITNPATGANTVMTDVLTYGGAATDNLVLLTGLNPSTPVGTQAANPVSVRVLAADGVTPVAGATIAWSATNSVQLSACNSASACLVTSDQDGNAATWLTPTATGVSTITVTLAPGVYSVSPSVQATLNATESASDLGVLTPYLWIAQGATTTVPLTAIVLSNGVPQNNVTVNFTVASGSATLSAPSAVTNSSGYASVNLSLMQFSSEVQVNACVAPANAPCQQIYAISVPASQLNLQPVAGAGQITAGQAFQPIVVRVVDSAVPPHAVLAAPVMFQTTLLRQQGTSSGGAGGETNPINPGMPIILSVSQSIVPSDINGMASITPSSGSFGPPLEADVVITAGATASINDSLQLLPGLSGDNEMEETSPLPARPIGSPVRVAWPVER
jgi:hypothetical protein